MIRKYTLQFDIGEKPFLCSNYGNLFKYSNCQKYMEISTIQCLTKYATIKWNKYKLNSVQQFHIGEKPFQCTDCDNGSKWNKCRESVEISQIQYLNKYPALECDKKYKFSSSQLNTMYLLTIKHEIGNCESSLLSDHRENTSQYNVWVNRNYVETKSIRCASNYNLLEYAKDQLPSAKFVTLYMPFSCTECSLVWTCLSQVLEITTYTSNSPVLTLINKRKLLATLKFIHTRGG